MKISFKKILHILAIYGIALFLLWLAIFAFNNTREDGKTLYTNIGNTINNFAYTTIPNPSEKVVIVKIDNATLDYVQEASDVKVFSFPKKFYIDLIEKIESAGVRAIGFDIVFANKSADDASFVETLRKYKNIVLAVKTGVDPILPLDIFSGATYGGITMDYVGTTGNRYTMLQAYWTGKYAEVLGLALYRKFISDPIGMTGTIIQSGGSLFYKVNPRYTSLIPLQDDCSALIPFFRFPKEYPSYSMRDILEWKVNPDVFKDKIVLVGEYGTLIHDEHLSPIDSKNFMPWVEFHANFIDGLIQKKFISTQSSFEKYTYLLFWLAILVGVYFFISVKFGFPLFVLTIVAIFIIAADLYSHSWLLIDLFSYQLAFAIIPFPTVYFYRYFIIDKDRRYLEKAFAHYISPELVKQIAQNPEQINLGGQSKELTVFFSDIAGFTTISELLGTQKLFPLMSEYLTEMTDIFTKYQGTLDKYIWDAVMGFFGAPISVDNPEFRACKVAIEQQKRLILLNQKWLAQGYPPVKIRIGISTGEVMVGNIGSNEHFNYTVLGDTVNLASRLEWVNKEYATNICVSEFTYNRVKDLFYFRKLDKLRVKWKIEGVTIYELVWFQDDISIDKVKYQTYEQALELYFEGKYQEAMELFQTNTKDQTSYILSDRCKKALAWEVFILNGVYEMKTK